MAKQMIEQMDQKVKDKLLHDLLFEKYQKDTFIDDNGIEHYIRLELNFADFVNYWIDKLKGK
jgi:hypothetical protein